MKENRQSLPKGGAGVDHLQRALAQLNLEALARQTGFARRQPKKLSPLAFIQSCCLVLLQGRASLRQWALLIGVLGHQTYSKQALQQRLGGAAARFVQSVLQALLVHLSQPLQRVLPPGLEAFPRVILQDSTILTLPAKLARFFAGSRNQAGYRGAMIRVQSFYDLKHERFVHFRHSAFTRHDAKGAQDGLEHLRPGDLLVRDLGYFVLPVLRQLRDRQIFFLSRFKIGTGVCEPAGRPLDLARTLRHRTRPLDRAVLLGQKEQLPVRLVAVRVPEAVANQRRRVARANRHYRPTKKHLILLGWALFVTNVGRELWPTQLVARIYGLRWRVETIFKAWKSHFHLEDVPAGSRAEVEVLLYARLLWISLFEVCFLARWDYQIQKEPAPGLSLLKLAGFLPLYLAAAVLRAFQPALEKALLQQVPYHCSYEKRRKRKNFVEQLDLT